LDEACDRDQDEQDHDDDGGGGSHEGANLLFPEAFPPGLERRVTQKDVGAPINEGPDYMKKGSVTVGRAGRLSVHTWDERALGMRGTVYPPSCMRPHYRPRRVIS
jgi:hypothetical protein